MSRKFSKNSYMLVILLPYSYHENFNLGRKRSRDEKYFRQKPAEKKTLMIHIKTLSFIYGL